MTARLLRGAVAASLALALCGAPWSAYLPVSATAVKAAGTTFPVSEIRRGQVAEGVTRMDGDERVTFKAHILGVLDGVIGPKRQVILARLEGAGLENTGVIAGMSGSPVYIDGRLVGAVAYSMGQFAKAPIAGITPIAEMEDATAASAAAPPRRVASFPLDTALTAEALREAFLASMPGRDGVNVSPASMRGFGLDTVSSPVLRPIATPLAMAGFSTPVGSWLSDTFAAAGFAPVSGGAGMAVAETGGVPAAATTAPLQPGDAVGVSLVSGDLSLGATGTVTSVEGTRVLAFGHPFFNLGPAQLPMTRAHVVAVIPSLLNSIKLAQLGEVMGVLDQDRATAIAGTLGVRPRTIPLTVAMRANGGTSRSFAFEVAEDQLFSPLIVFAAVANVLQSYQREVGVSTIRMKGAAEIGASTLRMDNVFGGDSAVVTASASLAAPLAAVLRSDLGTPRIGRITLEVDTDERQRSTRLDRAWIAQPRPRAGDTVTLMTETRSFRSAPQVQRLQVPIPATATGTLQLQVIDGTTLAQLEGRRRSLEQARSVDELVGLLNQARRGDRWYVRLTRQAQGSVVNGRDLPALPGSVMQVLGAAPGVVATTLDQDVLGEWELPADAVATGQRTIAITPIVP
ncbi:SpoIVB peptidase S55 domain-containing protein [Luteitalea pratensis]|uniref:SpoIVB peptidase S55 domain-containing protein n=1 Tax=Luteitalea pratensis TaxID=1855912 RepID=UPI00138FFA3A|nr:SpoIVB peptidase S55 domain-containing protein [Luteitalea pratensis]